MTSLAIVRKHDHTTVVASPIYLVDPIPSKPGAEVAFEMFDANTAQLRGLIGQRHCFSVADGAEPFWARLKSIEPYVSTRPELAVKHRPTLRVVLEIVEAQAGAAKAVP